MKVRAGQTGGVEEVDDDGAVPEEAGRAGPGGGVEVEVGGLEGAGAGDVAVLTA